MDDNLLKNLIQAASVRPQAAGENPLQLAARIRAIHGQRRRSRLAVAASAFVLTGCLLWRFMPPGHAPRADKPLPEVAIATPIVPEQPERKLQALREQIDREERIVRGLLAAQRARRLNREVQEVSQRMTVPVSRDEQIGPVAAGYLVSGDRKREVGLPVASARADYARVVKLFPETLWADRAKARLASLNP